MKTVSIVRKAPGAWYVSGTARFVNRPKSGRFSECLSKASPATKVSPFGIFIEHEIPFPLVALPCFDSALKQEVRKY